MKSLLFLTLLFSQVKEESTIYILVDDSKPSVVLRNELTQDWTKGKYVNDTCYALDNKRIELSSKLKLVHYLDYKSMRENNIYDTREYPSYRVGRYKKFTSFPKEGLSTTSFPLLTTIALQNNETRYSEEIDWKETCKNKIMNARQQYIGSLVQWATDNKLEESNSIFSEYYCPDETDGTIAKIAKKYSHMESMPMFTMPTLPKCPIKKFPFESQQEEVYSFSP